MKRFFSICLLLFMCVPLLGYFHLNGIECFITPNLCDDGGENQLTTNDLRLALKCKGLQVKSAKQLISAYALFFRYLEAIETNNSKLAESRRSELINQLFLADQDYLAYSQLVAEMRLDEPMVERLITFNYEDFQKEYFVNNSTLDLLRSYLDTGNLPGLCEYFSLQINSLYLAILETNLNDTSSLGKISLKFSKIMQEGQVAANVFSKVLK